jgi:multiple sugar transport system permease protein
MDYSTMQSQRQRARTSYLVQRWLVAGLLIAPFAVAYGLFLIYPSIRVFQLSFTDADIAGVGKFTGIENYTNLMNDPDFWASLWHTVYFTLLTVIPNTALGFLFALMVVRLKRLQNLMLAAFFLPNILPVSVVTTVWQWILDPNFGIVNNVSQSGINWFQDPAYAMPSVAFVTIWWTVGFNVLLFVAALKSIPKEYYEAASLDGADTFQMFRYITWPSAWPVTSLVLVLQLIAQFKIFDQVYLLTGGGPFDSTRVLLLQLYQQAFQQQKGGYSSAIAVVLLIVIVVASLIQNRLLNRSRSA